MLGRGAWVSTLAIALAAPSSATAQDPAQPVGVVREFAILCMGSDGDPDEARRRALATGYVAISLGDAPAEMGVENGEAFLKGGVPTFTLILGESRRRFDGVQLDMGLCGVMSSSEAFDDVARGAEAFLGHAPILEGSGQRLFAWTALAAGRTPFEGISPAQLRRFSSDGTLRFGLVGREGSGSWVGLVRPNRE